MSRDPPDIEFIGLGLDDGEPQETFVADASRADRWGRVVLFALVAAIVGWLALADTEARVPPEGDGAAAEVSPARDELTTGRGSERFDALLVAQSIPRPLLMAELFAAKPTASGLRALFQGIGGFASLQLATAEGAFDLVRFDPTDRDRLLASQRSSYGEADNRRFNEIWQLSPHGEINQLLWSSVISHDFIHYNIDGTATMWAHGGGDGFAPRIATVLAGDLTPMSTTEPLYASRMTSTRGTVFALTGNGDYYTNDPGYVELVADDGTGARILDDGSQYAWIDNPTPDILVAYPNNAEGSTAVWDAATLTPLPTHPLSGRAYRGLAISADHTIAVGATFDGELEVIDVATGLAKSSFGDVDIAGVDQPLTLNHDGTIAVTVEHSGRVTIWWVGDDRPIASILADQAQPRWVSSKYAPTSASAVTADTSRIALRIAARAGTPTSWIIVDTDPGSWIRRACEQAGRSLSDREVQGLGLPDGPQACTI